MLNYFWANSSANLFATFLRMAGTSENTSCLASGITSNLPLAQPAMRWRIAGWNCHAFVPLQVTYFYAAIWQVFTPPLTTKRFNLQWNVAKLQFAKRRKPLNGHALVTASNSTQQIEYEAASRENSDHNLIPKFWVLPRRPSTRP